MAIFAEVLAYLAAQAATQRRPSAYSAMIPETLFGAWSDQVDVFGIDRETRHMADGAYDRLGSAQQAITRITAGGVIQRDSMAKRPEKLAGETSWRDGPEIRRGVVGSDTRMVNQ